jgi:hypothetical protein
MWSHGYNYHDRARDRDYVFKNLLKEKDDTSTGNLYKWGVKYVVHEASSPRKEKLDEKFLTGHIKRVFQAGQFHVYRVRYDGEPF